MGIAAAMLFLTQGVVSKAPLADKRAFLVGKGLSSLEVSEALTRVAAMAPAVAWYNFRRPKRNERATLLVKVCWLAGGLSFGSIAFWFWRLLRRGRASSTGGPQIWNGRPGLTAPQLECLASSVRQQIEHSRKEADALRESLERHEQMFQSALPKLQRNMDELASLPVMP